MIDYLSRRSGMIVRIAPLLHLCLIIICIAFSAMLVKIRVIDSGWNEGEYLYKKTDRLLVENGARPDEIVMVRNPPAYFIMTGRTAIAIPDGNIQALLTVVRKFNARYIILEHGGVPSSLIDLYQHPDNYPEFVPMETLDDNLILSIKPTS